MSKLIAAGTVSSVCCTYLHFVPRINAITSSFSMTEDKMFWKKVGFFKHIMSRADGKIERKSEMANDETKAKSDSKPAKNFSVKHDL